MIITRPEWFNRIKYDELGVGMKSWQESAYIIVFLSSNFNTSSTILENRRKIDTYFGWLIFLLLDLVDVVWKTKR
ncbi:MAG: hypothetical protein Kow0019_04400 [Methanobacteriaceae archaeon]